MNRLNKHRRSLERGLTVAAGIGLPFLCAFDAAFATTAPQPCAVARSTPDVRIAACTFRRVDSEVGNPNYYLDVTVTYTALRAVDVVQFVVNAGEGDRPQVNRQHLDAGGTVVQTFRLLSPANIAGVTVAASGAS